MKKKFLTALILIGSIGIVHAQSDGQKSIHYGYDNAGNRISRTIVVNNS